MCKEKNKFRNFWKRKKRNTNNQTKEMASQEYQAIKHTSKLLIKPVKEWFEKDFLNFKLDLFLFKYNFN